MRMADPKARKPRLNPLQRAGAFASGLGNLAKLNFGRAISDFGDAVGLNGLEKKFILGTTLVGVSAGALLPYMPDEIQIPSKGLLSYTFADACDDPRVSSGDTNIKALTMLASERAKTNPVEESRYRSAMQAVRFGVHPLALYYLSGIESSGGMNVVSSSSSAEGFSQFTTANALDNLSRYENELPSLNAIRTRFKAGEYADPALAEMDRDIIRAISHVLGEYKVDPRAMVNRIERGRVSGDEMIVLNFARHNPVVSGELTALFVARTAPELLLVNTVNDTPDDIRAKTVPLYRPHLLGPTGGAFLNYVLAQAPSTPMNNPTVLAALYEASPYSTHTSTSYMANYYVNIAGGNPGVIIEGARGTARELAAQMDSWTSNRIQGDLSAMNNMVTRIQLEDLCKPTPIEPAPDQPRISLAQILDRQMTGGVVQHIAVTAFQGASAWIAELQKEKEPDPIANLIVRNNTPDAQI